MNKICLALLLGPLAAAAAATEQSVSPIDKALSHYHNGAETARASEFGAHVAMAAATPAEAMAAIERVSGARHREACHLEVTRPDAGAIELIIRANDSLGLMRFDSAMKPQSGKTLLDGAKAHGFVENAPFAILDEKVKAAIGPEYHAVQIRRLAHATSADRSKRSIVTFQVLKVYYGDTPHGPVLLATELKSFDSESFLMVASSLHSNEETSGLCEVYGTAKSRFF